MPRVHKLSFSSVSLYLSPTIQKFYQRSIIEKSKGWGCQNGSTVDSSEGRNPSGEFKSSYWIRVYECVLIKQSPRQWSHRIMEKFEGSINLMRHSGVKATRIHLIWALLDLFQTIWILNQDFWLYLHQLFLVPKKRLRGHLDSIFTNHCQVRSQDLLHVAEDPIDCACCDNCKRSCLVPDDNCKRWQFQNILSGDLRLCNIFALVWFLASVGVYSRRVIDLFLNGNGLVWKICAICLRLVLKCVPSPYLLRCDPVWRFAVLQ